MEIKLGDSEISVMEVLWEHGVLPAKEISDILEQQMGWTMSTTYTLIRRCIKKGAIKRTDPHFVCHPLIGREQVQEQETTALINKVFGGSADLLFVSLLNRKTLTPEEIRRLKEIVNELE